MCVANLDHVLLGWYSPVFFCACSQTRHRMWVFCRKGCRAREGGDGGTRMLMPTDEEKGALEREECERWGGVGGIEKREKKRKRRGGITGSSGVEEEEEKRPSRG